MWLSSRPERVDVMGRTAALAALIYFGQIVHVGMVAIDRNGALTLRKSQI
jgi:hypothetical protein